ncbi:MAG: helix-turn-helix domain-containing protein [Bacilli bacterium]
MKRLWTVAEVAERLELTEDAVYRLARQKILPCVRIGRMIRFDEQALDEWIRNGGQAWEGGWRKTTH